MLKRPRTKPGSSIPDNTGGRLQETGAFLLTPHQAEQQSITPVDPLPAGRRAEGTWLCSHRAALALSRPTPVDPMKAQPFDSLQTHLEDSLLKVCTNTAALQVLLQVPGDSHGRGGVRAVL